MSLIILIFYFSAFLIRFNDTKNLNKLNHNYIGIIIGFIIELIGVILGMTIFNVIYSYIILNYYLF